MNPTLILLGIVLVLTGLILGFIAMLRMSGVRRSTSSRGGAVILIGPIPIVFASDSGTAKLLMTLAIILVAFLIALLLLQVIR